MASKPKPENKTKGLSQTSITINSDGSRRSLNSGTASIVSLRRKLSLAQSFSQRVVTEHPLLDPKTSEAAWGPSVGQRVEESVVDISAAGKELEHAKSIEIAAKERRNIRAEMGFFKLFWFDFKTWYRRWYHKRAENPFLRKYIKDIERSFGSGMGAMFLFSRWLILLNLFLALIWSCFVTIPMAVNFDYASVVDPFAYRNLLDGKGPVAKSWVFYCAYVPNTYAKMIGLPDFHYHIGLAYLIAVLITTFGSLLAIFKNMAVVEEPSGSYNEKFRFTFLLWSSWDHSITSPEAALNLRKGITSAIKDSMYHAKAQEQKDMKRSEMAVLVLRRFAAWLLTFILVGGGCCVITYLVLFVNFDTGISEPIAIRNISIEALDLTTDTNFIRVYVTPITISVINIIVSVVIVRIPTFEQYRIGQTELNVTIGRIFLLRMANLFALVASLYTITKESTSDILDGDCMGAIIGQEIYKLVIMDTLIYAIFKVLVYYGMFYWQKEKSEFDIPSAILVLIYRQALIWIGTVVCPVLPFVGALSAITFFFVNYSVVKNTCKPPIKRWRQNKRTLFFMSCLLLTLIAIIIPVSIIIGSTTINLGRTGEKTPPQGPFSSFNLPTSSYSDFVGSLSIKWLREFLLWLISNTVTLPVFLTLITLLGYQKIRLSSEKNHCLILQAELHQEREDNRKLLKNLQAAHTTGLAKLK